MSIPTLTIEGNLTEDPKHGTTSAGKSWANFTVIAKNSRKDEAGNWVDGDKCPMRVAVFGRLAANCATTLHKGMAVIVQGRQRQTKYQAQDGSVRYSYELCADKVGVELTFVSATVTKNQKNQQATTAPAAAPPTDPWMDDGFGEPDF